MQLKCFVYIPLFAIGYSLNSSSDNETFVCVWFVLEGFRMKHGFLITHFFRGFIGIRELVCTCFACMAQLFRPEFLVAKPRVRDLVFSIFCNLKIERNVRIQALELETDLRLTYYGRILGKIKHCKPKGCLLESRWVFWWFPVPSGFWKESGVIYLPLWLFHGFSPIFGNGLFLIRRVCWCFSCSFSV